MPISIVCTHCQKKLKVADVAAGKKVRCPACTGVLAIPAAEEEFVEPEEFEEPEKETAVSKTPQPPKKKPAWDKDDDDASETSGSPDDKEDYGFSEHEPSKKKKKRRYEDDDDDDKDDDEDEAPRRRRKKRRRNDDYADYREPRGRRGEPHRGVLILVLGIVALFGACLCAIIGWGLGAAVVSMANNDLARMETGAMDRSGSALTTAGKACGIIAVGLGIINAILGIAFNLQNVNHK